DILRMLRDADAGRADLVIADGNASERESRDRFAGRALTRPGWTGGKTGPHAHDGWASSVTPAVDLVKAPGELAAAVERLLAGVPVVPARATGLELVLPAPPVWVVTADGDLLGAHWARGGSAGGQSVLGLRAAAQQATKQLAEAEQAAQRAERELAEAAEEEEQARQGLAEAQAALQEVDAAAAQGSGRLGSLAGAARAAQDEAGRLVAAIAAADRSAEKSRTQLADIEARVAAESQDDNGPSPDATAPLNGDEPGAFGDTPTSTAGDRVRGRSRQALADSAAAARRREMDARLEVRTVEERLRAISGRADALASAAVAERQAISRAAERAKRRAAEAKIAAAVATGAKIVLTSIERSLRLADGERRQAEVA